MAFVVALAAGYVAYLVAGDLGGVIGFFSIICTHMVLKGMDTVVARLKQ
jgi:hypothetical protein